MRVRMELLALIVCSASSLQLPTTAVGRRAAVSSASALQLPIAAALGRRAVVSSAAAAVSLVVPQLANAAKPEKLYCLNVVLRVKAERRDEFLKCIANNQVGTLTKEPLAVEYTYGEDETTPNTFHFHEKYKGRAGFEAHTKAPHFAVYAKFARGRVNSGHSAATALSRGPRGLPTHSAPPVTARRRIRIHSPHLQKLFSTKPSRCRARARDVVLHADQLRFLHVTCTFTCACACACACTCLCNVTVGDVPPSHAHRPARDRVHCAHVHKLCSYIRAKIDLEVLAEVRDLLKGPKAERRERSSVSGVKNTHLLYTVAHTGTRSPDPVPFEQQKTCTN